MAQLTPWLTQKFYAADGTTPLAGGKVYTYDVGTTTPKDSYTTYVGDVANANPVILDADGEPDSGGIWMASGGYKFVVKTSADVTIDTYDGVNQSGTDDVGVVATFAALRALSEGEFTSVEVLGYTTAGDGGGGTVRWNSGGDQSTPNNVTTFAPSIFKDGGTWDRVYSGRIDIKWGGAAGDSGDDTSAINAVLAWAQANDGDVYVSEGTYRIASGVTVGTNTKLIMAVDAMFTASTAITLTINGKFEAGIQQCFAGSLVVVFADGSVPSLYPDWWYDGGGDWRAAFNVVGAYANKIITITDKTHEISNYVYFSGSDNTVYCKGIIKAQDSADFGAYGPLWVAGTDTEFHGLNIDGNRDNIVDNLSAGTQPAIEILSGSKRIKFYNTQIYRSVYPGVLSDGTTEDIVFDGIYMEDIGEHCFYWSGGLNKRSVFRNVTIVDYSQNTNMAVDHGSYVIRLRSTGASTNTNEDIIAENINASIPSGEGSVGIVSAVFSFENADGVRATNIKGADMDNFAICVTYNAKNIVLDNIEFAGSVFGNVSTGDPNVENVVLKNSHFTTTQFVMNVCRTVENCIFENAVLTDAMSANMETGHSTTFKNCIWTGDTLAVEKVDLIDLEYPIYFRDCYFEGDVTGSTSIVEFGQGYVGTPSSIKFFNCDFSGCTNLGRLTLGVTPASVLSFDNCILQDDIQGHTTTDVIITNCDITDVDSVIQFDRVTLSNNRGATRRVVASRTVSIFEDVLFCDTDSGVITLDLVAGISGMRHNIVNTGSSGNNIEFNPDGAETMDGTAAISITDGNSAEIRWEPTEYWWTF